jgi:hypothetical protein
MIGWPGWCRGVCAFALIAARNSPIGVRSRTLMLGLNVVYRIHLREGWIAIQ